MKCPHCLKFQVDLSLQCNEKEVKIFHFFKINMHYVTSIIQRDEMDLLAITAHYILPQK